MFVPGLSRHKYPDFGQIQVAMPKLVVFHSSIMNSKLSLRDIEPNEFINLNRANTKQDSTNDIGAMKLACYLK